MRCVWMDLDLMHCLHLGTSPAEKHVHATPKHENIWLVIHLYLFLWWSSPQCIEAMAGDMTTTQQPGTECMECVLFRARHAAWLDPQVVVLTALWSCRSFWFLLVGKVPETKSSWQKKTWAIVASTLPNILWEDQSTQQTRVVWQMWTERGISGPVTTHWHLKMSFHSKQTSLANTTVWPKIHRPKT